MVLNLTPEQEAKIAEQAKLTDRSPEEMVTEAALWLLQFEQNHEASLQRSLEQADRGQFVDEKEVEARFARMLEPR